MAMPGCNGQCGAEYRIDGATMNCVLEIRHAGPHEDAGGNWQGVSAADRREQAVSFAYGNIRMHNPEITRERVEAAYDRVFPGGARADAPYEPLFYIQDTRSTVGNSALWWAEGGHGYTCDLRHAWKVPASWKPDRDTDLLRRCDVVDALAERHVDVQKLRDPESMTKAAMSRAGLGANEPL